MKDQNGNILWNLLLLETGKKKEYKVVLPDNNGNLPEIPDTQKGFFVSWCTNPNFTGKSAICIILSGLDWWKGYNFI